MPDRVEKPAQWTFGTFRFSLHEKNPIKEWKLLDTFQWKFFQMIAKIDREHNRIVFSCIYFLYGTKFH